jgi:hypothetical protein
MSTASGDEYLVVDSTSVRTEGAAVVSRKPPVAQWPYLLVCLIALGGLGLVGLGMLREGLLGLALSMAVAGIARLVLPTTTAGWLGTRSRGLDAMVFATLAVALGAVTLLLSA